MSIHPTIPSEQRQRSCDPVVFAMEFMEHYDEYLSLQWQPQGNQYLYVATQPFEGVDSRTLYQTGDNIGKHVIMQMMNKVIESTIFRMSQVQNDPDAFMRTQRARCCNKDMIRQSVDMLGIVSPSAVGNSDGTV